MDETAGRAVGAGPQDVRQTSEIDETEHEQMSVERDGKRNLSFQGVLIAEEDNRWIAGREGTRWDEYALYRTKGGGFVLAHTYRTLWQGELSSHEAWIGDTAEAVLDQAKYLDGDQEVYPQTIKELAEKAGVDLSEHLD